MQETQQKFIGIDARKTMFVLAAIFITYLLVAVLFGLTKYPSDDEAWFSSSAMTLLETGQMGISVKEVEGTMWTRMDQYTYWQPPLHFLFQAIWYAIFGFSLMSMRISSALWGIVALIAIYNIVLGLSRNRTASVLAVGIMAFDFTFINSAADGRMDMMCVALALTGFATYIRMRERNLNLAMLIGHTCIVGAGLTHAHGIVPFGAMILLNLWMDLKRIRIRHVLIALIPYVIGGLGWGIYIMQDPQAFHDQFLGHVSRKTVTSPSIFHAFWMEIQKRYLTAYGFVSGGSLVAKFKIIALLIYIVGVVVSLTRLRSKDKSGEPVLLVLLGFYFITQSLLIQEKSNFYLLHVLPFYAMLLAIALSSVWNRTLTWKVAVVLVVVIFFGINLGTEYRRIVDNDYKNIYLQVAQAMEPYDSDGRTVMASAEYAFELGFDENFIDDPTLGYYTGRTPDVILLTPWYEKWFRVFENQRPELGEYVSNLLDNEFVEVYTLRIFSVYVRKTLIGQGNSD